MRWTITLCTTLMLVSNMFGQGQSAIIVKQVALTNQTAFIPPTVLVTPNSNALYRVSAYFEVLSRSQGQCDSFYLNLGWTDASPSGNGRRTLMLRDCSVLQDSDQMTVVASDLAGKPLGYSVKDANRVPPAVPFNVYITVEQLQ
jgi:hypothetical protein